MTEEIFHAIDRDCKVINSNEKATPVAPSTNMV